MNLAQRIQKVLANAGLGSRREIDRWVTQGRVTVDGRAAKPGDQLRGNERICLDGRALKLARAPKQERPSFLVYYKPSGESQPVDDGKRRALKLELPKPPKHGRWISIGGLDTKTSGLVLLSTDGDLAHRLTKGPAQVEREYAVRLLGHPKPEQLELLLTGIDLDTGPARVESVEPAGGTGTNVWYHIVLREGGSRQLRELLAASGLAVSRMIRVRYGPVKLGQLRRGQNRTLDRAEIDALYRLASGTRSAARAPRRTPGEEHDDA